MLGLGTEQSALVEAMAAESAIVDADTLAELVEHDERHKLRLILNEQHPADLGEMLQDLEFAARLYCFRLLDLEHAGAVLSEMDAENQRALLKALGDRGVVPILSQMSPDDAVDLLGELPQEKAKSIIEQLSDEDIGDIYELMSFKDDTAGGIMSTDFLAVHAGMSVEEVLDVLREKYEQFDDELYDLFVVDEKELLVGYLSVKDLLTAAPDDLVETLMDRAVISVTTDADQEIAAEKLSRYDLLSLPVVDHLGKLCGVITADDAIDVLKEEADEDIYKASGITPEEGGESLSSSVRHSFRARLPWLVVTLAIESVAAMVITRFDFVIQQTVVAAAFMPLLTSVTGSVAMQSTCIIMRNSRKQFSWRAAWRNLWHEMRVGVLLGLACGVVTSGISVLFKTHTNLGLIVGISLILTMSVGVLIGTLIPIIFEKLGIEPAHASGPLITSLLDVCTMTIYLSIVYAFLSHIS